MTKKKKARSKSVPQSPPAGATQAQVKRAIARLDKRIERAGDASIERSLRSTRSLWKRKERALSKGQRDAPASEIRRAKRRKK